MCEWAGGWLRRSGVSVYDSGIETFDESEHCPSLLPKTCADNEIISEEIKHKITALPETEQSVVQIFMACGSVKEVAQILNCSRNRIYRILKGLAA